MVVLRDPRPADEEQWLQWINDPDIIARMDFSGPVTQQLHTEFLKTAVAGNSRARWFAIERAGRFIGKVWLWDIHPRHRRAEVRILIGDRSEWGSGAGSGALSAVAARAFGELQLHKLYAFIHVVNVGSARAFCKAGFFEEALLREEVFHGGGFYDVRRFALIARGTTLPIPAVL